MSADDQSSHAEMGLESWSAKAKRLGISYRTLDRWAECGVVKTPVKIRNRKYGPANEMPRHDAAAD
jgi:predicted site-specific integrase-resolvase